MKRYESSDSIYSTNSYMNGFVPVGIPVESHVEVNDIGRLERPSWSIDHIAHADEQRVGWCCF